MCITFFCSCPETKGQLKFVLAFNREEQTRRETLRLGQFSEDCNIYGGRDVTSGGTWLGVNIRTGLLVFLTNFITPLPFSRQGTSRGKIVSHFLSTAFIPQGKQLHTDEIVLEALQEFSKRSQEFTPFNLTVCNLRTARMFYMCSEWQEPKVMELSASRAYALSNADIRTEWMKTKHGSVQFQSILSRIDQLEESKLIGKLTNLMQNSTNYNDLPDGFSSIFVEPHWHERVGAERMTKQTTVLLCYEREGRREVVMKELTYGGKQEEVLLKLMI